MTKLLWVTADKRAAQGVSAVNERSNRAAVRNPMLAIPEVRAEYEQLPPEARAALMRMLQACSKVFRVKGNEAWRKHKPPVAAYWKANAVNARHLALAGRVKA